MSWAHDAASKGAAGRERHGAFSEGLERQQSKQAVLPRGRGIGLLANRMRDLNDLQFFTAVVEHRSFSAAARLLGIPKSRVSRRVALLEERLGVRLLERSTRSLNVTEVGHQIYGHARAAMEEADAVDVVALSVRSEPRGLVRVSCPLGLREVLTHRLPAFLAANPELRVQVIMTNRGVDLVEEGIDVALRVRERLDMQANVQTKKIGTSKRILVAAPQFLQERGQPLVPGDLARFPLLCQQEQQGPSSLTLMNDVGERESLEFHPRLAIGDFDSLIAAARAGVGISLVPRASCKKELASGELVNVLPAWCASDGIVHLVFTSRRSMLPGVRAVVDFAADALRAATD
jgi:DNA-binding transcriptional LysR family regulator